MPQPNAPVLNAVNDLGDGTVEFLFAPYTDPGVQDDGIPWYLQNGHVDGYDPQTHHVIGSWVSPADLASGRVVAPIDQSATFPVDCWLEVECYSTPTQIAGETIGANVKSAHIAFDPSAPVQAAAVQHHGHKGKGHGA